jgi:hypothetical protein
MKHQPRGPRFPGKLKYVAWSDTEQAYVHYSCLNKTTDRNYAWVGTVEQFHNMRKAYPWTESYKMYLDGTERK